MMHKLFATIRQNRVLWSCALLVALFLVAVGHAPAIPVLAGCAFAIVLTTMRSTPGHRPKLKTFSVRGGYRG